MKLLSNFAFYFNLRPYTVDGYGVLFEDFRASSKMHKVQDAGDAEVGHLYVESREGTFVKWMNRALCRNTSAEAEAEANAERARVAANASEEGAAERARQGGH